MAATQRRHVAGRQQRAQYTHQCLHEHAQAVLAPDHARLANAHRWGLKVDECGGENHERGAGIVDAVVLPLVEDVAARLRGQIRRHFLLQVALGAEYAVRSRLILTAGAVPPRAQPAFRAAAATIFRRN